MPDNENIPIPAPFWDAFQYAAQPARRAAVADAAEVRAEERPIGRAAAIREAERARRAQEQIRMQELAVQLRAQMRWNEPNPMHLGRRNAQVRVEHEGIIVDEVEHANAPDEFVDVKINPIVHIEWGGADLDPSFYGMERSNRCGRSDINQDEQSIARIKKAIDQGIPVIGICRGAQIANVVNGGILIQHIDEHTRNHNITLYDLNGDLYKDNVGVTSTHHQMMIAHQDGIILGKDNRGTTGVHWENVNDPHFYKYVTEVVYYPKTKTLCIQPHPEWMRQDSPFVNWINAFIQEHMGLGPINFAEAEFNHIRNGDF